MSVINTILREFFSNRDNGYELPLSEEDRIELVKIAEEHGLNKLDEEDDEDPCWEDYEMIGTKTKDGKEVPNCVPKNESVVYYKRNIGDYETSFYVSKSNVTDLINENDIPNGSIIFDDTNIVNDKIGSISESNSDDEINEVNAISGGKIHKFITAKNVSIKGEDKTDVEFEVKSIDNTNKKVRLEVLFPKNLMGEKIDVPFRTIRRGPFVRTETDNTTK